MIADCYSSGSYLTDFLSNHFIETFAALIGFNIPAIIFLLGQLMNLENQLGVRVDFDNTRKKIKQSSYFLLSSFVACLVLLILRPELQETAVLKENIWYYFANIIILAIFLLAIFVIYDILQAIFLLSKNVGELLSKNVGEDAAKTPPER